MSQSTRLRPDAEAGQSHSAAHRDGSLAPNPPAGLVPKDHPPKRSRRGSGGVRVLAAVACLAWLAWPTEAFAQQVTLNVDAVAGDNKINQSEHRNGIAVSGNTGTESGVTVEVTIGGRALTSVTSAMNAMWSVDVKASADYITETSVELSVTATKTGFTSATVTRTLPVDLTPPSVSYTAPSSLTVGVLITPIAPTTSDTDIVSYATSGSSLPLGLVLNGATGLISGEPRTANTNTQTVGVLVTDDAGNVDRPQIRFPAVELAAGVTFSPPTGLFVPEGGSAGYTVVLDVQPTDDVTITVMRGGGGDEDLTATPDILTFTDSNWDMPQTVTVSAAEDADGKAGIASFRHVADSLDASYSKGIPLAAVRVTEDDNDEIRVTVSPQRLMVLEGGSADYTVVLNTQPEGDVTVEATRDQLSDDDLTVSSDTDTDTDTNSVTFTFTDSNWDTPQTVTVSAAEDADESNGTATFSHGVVSLDTFDDDYANELTIDSVTATEVDAEIEPEVAITSNATGPVSGPFEVTITFSEPVEGFEREDIKIRNGTVVDFTEVSSSEYRITITPAQAGRPVAITISENVAEDGHGNGNQAVFFLIGVVLQVSYEEESYTATEGGETVTVTVKLSLGWKEELAIPIRVRRPETTEVSDYTVEGLEGWEAEEGVGKLIIGAGETEGSFKIQANSDGDGDDETVELGFGELPKRVMTGKPAKATLTLKDKGLVELKVSFGQAEYQIKEGHQADIEVTISPAADRRVEVPLEVALEGGATPEDYSGAPASVVFEEGESQGTISVEALADEENDPGEGIVLSLGGLPEAVSAGDPSSTQVHFRQQRTAEQFSRTLEVMLAVIARSTAESAQTAIEGRFERHRQLSRMGSSGGAMQAPKPGTSEAARGGAPASSHSGTGLGPEESAGVGRGSIDDTGSRGEEGPVEPGAWVTAKTRPATGSGWDLESQQRGTQGSWLRNFSLGGLGSIARSGQTHSGVSTGYGMGPSGTGLPVALGGQPGYGQNRFQGTGTRDSSLRPGSTEFSGMRGGGSLLESMLSRTSFELSLGEQEKEKGKNWVPVLWVQGDLLRFNGDLTRLGMNYRGGLKAAHVGLDLYANDQMLSGLSFMRSWGDMDYTDDGLDGVLDSRMNTVHPYLYWQPNERVSVWGIGGLGRGQVDVTEPSRTHDFDADFRMFAGGVRSVLTRRGNNEWGLRADAFTAQIETDASEGIAQVSGEAHRGRLMLEWVHDRELSAGRSLNLKAEAGGRFDGGDAERGSGVETGAGLGYLDANRGLDVSLHGRVLVVHESDYRDWGVGVQASWDPGEKQRGFRVSVNSSLGQDGGGRTTLWDNADAVMHPARMGAMGIGSQYRMESEVAYAGLEARGVPGLLTPYSRLRQAGQGRELALGTQWSLPTRSQQALPLMLELEAMRRENRTGPADLGVLLRVSIPLGGSRDVISGRDRVSTQAPDPKLIPRGIAESEADGPQPTAAAIKLPAEPVSAPQPDANLPPEPATPEAALPASQPAQASAQPQGSAPPSTTTAPARGEERVVNVQPTPQPGARTTTQPQSAASPTQTAELQAQVTPQQLKPRRQSPPAVTPSDSSAPTVLPSGGMVVQVGAFRSAERGARLTDELRQKGHAAITITIGGSDYHRVVVGPFPSRSDAASAQSQLEQQGYQGIYLRADFWDRLDPVRSRTAGPAF